MSDNSSLSLVIQNIQLISVHMDSFVRGKVSLHSPTQLSLTHGTLSGSKLGNSPDALEAIIQVFDWGVADSSDGEVAGLSEAERFQMVTKVVNLSNRSHGLSSTSFKSSSRPRYWRSPRSWRVICGRLFSPGRVGKPVC